MMRTVKHSCAVYAPIVLLGALIFSTMPTAAQLLEGVEQEVEAIKRSLICEAGQDCNSQAQESLGVRRRGLRRSFRFERKNARDQIEKKAREGKLPSIEREILFAYNSDTLLAPARRTLAIIGTAISDESLRKYRFVLIGHTDAKGSRAYNQRLSERRARSAREFLIKTFNIDASRLDAYGRGETALKLIDDPYSGENRRVQFVNVGLAE